MKFIIERKALARMLRGLGVGGKNHADRPLLRLAAQGEQVVLNSGEEAGYRAVVLEEGVCFLRPDQFLPLVRSYAGAKSLTIEVTPDGIQIGSTKITRGFWEISLFQNPESAPATLKFLPPGKSPGDNAQRELDLR